MPLNVQFNISNIYHILRQKIQNALQIRNKIYLLYSEKAILLNHKFIIILNITSFYSE